MELSRVMLRSAAEVWDMPSNSRVRQGEWKRYIKWINGILEFRQGPGLMIYY